MGPRFGESFLRIVIFGKLLEGWYDTVDSDRVMWPKFDCFAKIIIIISSIRV